MQLRHDLYKTGTTHLDNMYIASKRLVLCVNTHNIYGFSCCFSFNFLLHRLDITNVKPIGFTFNKRMLNDFNRFDFRSY